MILIKMIRHKIQSGDCGIMTNSIKHTLKTRKTMNHYINPQIKFTVSTWTLAEVSNQISSKQLLLNDKEIEKAKQHNENFHLPIHWSSEGESIFAFITYKIDSNTKQILTGSSLLAVLHSYTNNSIPKDSLNKLGYDSFNEFAKENQSTFLSMKLIEIELDQRPFDSGSIPYPIFPLLITS